MGCPLGDREVSQKKVKMKPAIFKFNGTRDILEWVLEDALEFVDALGVDFEKLRSEPVAFDNPHHYILYWEEGYCPSQEEVRTMLYSEGVPDEAIYDLTQTDLVV
jgi:hypothetical protein